MSNKNDWYEKGGLPPVGSVITAIDKRKSSGGIKCELKYMGADVCVLYDIDDDIEFAVHTCHVEFKPLRTERDALVEKTEMDIHQNHSDMVSRHHIRTLIDAGWRPVKQQTEDEFIAQGQELADYVITYQLSKLYRAGCRFIEQVKV